MLKPLPDQSLPLGKYSKKLIACKCSCGNPEVIQVRWNTMYRNPTCGRCAIIKWHLQGITKFGKLELQIQLNEVHAMRYVVPWKCECGNIKEIQFSRVVSGNTTSCGCAYSEPRDYVEIKHKILSKQEWLTKIPALVDQNLPNTWSTRSNIKCLFKCECSRTFVNSFQNYRPGKKCGHCDDIEIKNGFNINGFIYVGPDMVMNPKKLNKIECVCKECGKPDYFIVRYLFRGEYVRCKQCNTIETHKKKFGRLTIKNEEKLKRYSTKKIACICDCGNECEVTASNLLNSVTKSCGNCRKNVHDWWQVNQELLKSLKCPITELPNGGVQALEIIKGSHTPFSAKCPVCKSTYKPRLGDIKKGVSLTCGCTTNRVSTGQNEVFEYVKSLGVNAYLEFNVNNMKYDMGIPEKKILIEYNGLIWHRSLDRDLNKFKNATLNGYELISIFEDEWNNKKEIFQDILKNRFGLNTAQSVRSSKTEIKLITSQEADKFYEKFHYIGGCKAKINYGVFFDNKLITCASFKTPTRQSTYSYEITRMASTPEIRVHGIWNKILKEFIKQYQPSSIVSFSDNRLFTGKLYERLGFRLDKHLKPDYYWVYSNKRHHKSKLRKNKQERISGLTEVQIREAQGFHRIWDLGKKRWVLDVNLIR